LQEAELSCNGLLSHPAGVGSAKPVSTAKYECITRQFYLSFLVISAKCPHLLQFTSLASKSLWIRTERNKTGQPVMVLCGPNKLQLRELPLHRKAE